MNETEANRIAAASFLNRDRITAAPSCGCFYCLATVPGDDVREWVDDGRTALCPRCGIDSVLPDVTDDDTLRVLHHYRFEVTHRLDAAGKRERAAGE